MSEFKKSIQVNKDKITTEEDRRLYEQFVSEQSEQFISFINCLNQYVNKLKKDGVISQFLKFYARIKATKSALKNNNKKALDDVFGIEFICATCQEVEILQKELEPLLKIHERKELDKENGYKATHHFCTMKNGVINYLNNVMGRKINVENFPAIEIQYKTIEVYYESVYGKASHEKYKDTKLSQMQEMYNNDKITIGQEIPHMWISSSIADNMRELTKTEILRKMYPSLKLNEKQGEEIDFEACL